MILERLSAFFAGTDFRWWDVLDILIVAFLVYELLQFLRGTHAVQIALGGVSQTGGGIFGGAWQLVQLAGRRT